MAKRDYNVSLSSEEISELTKVVKSKIVEQIAASLSDRPSYQIAHMAGYNKSSGKNYGQYGKDASSMLDLVSNPVFEQLVKRIDSIDEKIETLEDEVRKR
jgi:predicted GTPase